MQLQKKYFIDQKNIFTKFIIEALENGMYDVIKIRLKRRDATRSKIKQKLYLKFGYPSFKIDRSTTALIFSGWFPFLLLVSSLLFRRIFMTSYMSLSSASLQKIWSDNVFDIEKSK